MIDFICFRAASTCLVWALFLTAALPIRAAAQVDSHVVVVDLPVEMPEEKKAIVRFALTKHAAFLQAGSQSELEAFKARLRADSVMAPLVSASDLESPAATERPFRLLDLTGLSSAERSNFNSQSNHIKMKDLKATQAILATLVKDYDLDRYFKDVRLAKSLDRRLAEELRTKGRVLDPAEVNDIESTLKADPNAAKTGLFATPSSRETENECRDAWIRFKAYEHAIGDVNPRALEDGFKDLPKRDVDAFVDSASNFDDACLDSSMPEDMRAAGYASAIGVFEAFADERAKDGAVFCTGIATSPERVLTARHCFFNPVQGGLNPAGRALLKGLVVFHTIGDPTASLGASLGADRNADAFAVDEDFIEISLTQPLAPAPPTVTLGRLPLEGSQVFLIGYLPHRNLKRSPSPIAGGAADAPEWLSGLRWLRTLPCHGYTVNPTCIVHTCVCVSGFSGSPLVAKTAEGSFVTIGIHSGTTAEPSRAMCRPTRLKAPTNGNVAVSGTWIVEQLSKAQLSGTGGNE